MNFIGIITGVVVLCVGILYAQNTKTTLGETETDDTPTVTESPTLSVADSPTHTASPTPTKVVNTPTEKPTHTPVPTNFSIDSSLSAFHYPGAAVLSSSSTYLELTNSDSSEKITNWYKDKITKLGMNTKSFVTTSTNGTIVNKLVAADGSTEIRVDITKSSGENITTIKVEMK